jgi:hypothetical protein
MKLPSIVEALADCLEAMRRGEDMEACLTMYPHYQEELRALLKVAAMIRPLPPEAVPSAAFQQDTRGRLLERSSAGTHQAPTLEGHEDL